MFMLQNINIFYCARPIIINLPVYQLLTSSHRLGSCKLCTLEPSSSKAQWRRNSSTVLRLVGCHVIEGRNSFEENVM